MATEHTLVIPAHCVMVPFLNRHEQVARCLDALITQAKPNTIFLLIDDGSTPQAIHSVPLQPILCNPNVYVIHHRDNYGVSAARNSGLHWCRNNGVEIAIMIDSDCMPELGLIDQHLKLHKEHPQAACIGGRIIGRGKGFWARLDGLASWVHASPHGASPVETEFRRVEPPYHLPTTNFSVKLDQLPPQDFVFDERLKTGEDCLLIRKLQAAGKNIYFSSIPRVYHQDRESMLAVFRHHYAWGHHQYFIQLGGNISPRCFNFFYRLFFTAVFLPLLPLFALAGSLLNIKPLKQVRRRWRLYPFIYLLWLAKGFAVLEAAIFPQRCLRIAREQVSYEEALLE